MVVTASAVQDPAYRRTRNHRGGPPGPPPWFGRLGSMDDVTDLLMEGDPSVRWRTRRDLLGLEHEADQARVATDGWGAELLSRQDPDGLWDGGHYSPKWTSTTYTLLMLRRLGLDPGNDQALLGCHRLFDDARWIRGGISYWKTHTEPETCVNSMILSLACWFNSDDERVHGLAECVLADHMPDGGWNCEMWRGATHSSFHTTISALEGLSEYGRRFPDRDVDDALAAGREFLNVHGMYRSHRTGEVINPVFGRTPLFPRWHFDILRGLEHYADVGAAHDERLAEVVGMLEDRRRPDGTWAANQRFSGRVWFSPERAGIASRWNTLRVMRVLRWWGGEAVVAG